MLRKFFFWLERGAYNAICRGCQKAVQDLSGGQVVFEVEPSLLTDESEPAGASPMAAKRTASKKQATRK